MSTTQEVSESTKRSTIAMENRKVLVLNKSWAPMHTIPLQKALYKVFNDKARIVDPEDYRMMTWEDWSKLKPLGDDGIRSAHMVFRIPQVIVLTDYDKIPQPRKTFSRRMLFRRDAYTCQFCGEKPGTENLSIDHLLARSKGGVTSWENCVTSCIECNAKKANRSLQEAGMTLLSKPGRPKYRMLQREELLQIDCFEQFVSTAYWNTPLDE